MLAGRPWLYLVITLLGLAGGCEARFVGQGHGQFAADEPMQLLAAVPARPVKTARTITRPAPPPSPTASASMPPRLALRGTIHDIPGASEVASLLTPSLRGSFEEESGG